MNIKNISRRSLSLLLALAIVFHFIVGITTSFAGTGSENDPYTVQEAIENNSGTKNIEGYIVGSAKNGSGGFVLNDKDVNSNIVIADSKDESDTSKMLVVQLPTKGNLRPSYNLVDNPGLLGTKVKITGSLERYFGKPGLKNPTSIISVGDSTPAETDEETKEETVEETKEEVVEAKKTTDILFTPYAAIDGKFQPVKIYEDEAIKEMKAHDNSLSAYVLKQNGEVKYNHNTKNLAYINFVNVEHGIYELELNLPKGYSINDRTFEESPDLTKSVDGKLLVDVNNSTNRFQRLSLYFTKTEEVVEEKITTNLVFEPYAAIDGKFKEITELYKDRAIKEMKAHDNSESAYVLKQNGEVKYNHNTKNSTNLSFLDVEHGVYELELNLPKGYSINDRTFENNPALTKTEDGKILVDVNSTKLYQNMSLYFTKRAETKVIFNFVDENGNKIEGLDPVVKNAPVTIKEGKTFITRLRVSDLPEGYKFAKVNTSSVEAETIYGSTKEVDVPLKVKDTDVTVSFNVKELNGSTKFLPQFTYTEVLTEDNKNFKDNGDGTYTYEMPSEKLPLGYKQRLENDGKVVVKKFGSERLLVELERSKGQVSIDVAQTNSFDKRPVPVLVGEDGTEYEFKSNSISPAGNEGFRREWKTDKEAIPSGKYKLVFRETEKGQTVEVSNRFPMLSSKVDELPDKETKLSGKVDEKLSLTFNFDQNKFPSSRYVKLNADFTEPKGKAIIKIYKDNYTEKTPRPVLVGEDGTEYNFEYSGFSSKAGKDGYTEWKTDNEALPSGSYKLKLIDTLSGQTVEVSNDALSLSSRILNLNKADAKLTGNADEEFKLVFDFDGNTTPSSRFVKIKAILTNPEVEMYQIGLEVRDLDNKKINDVKVEVLDKDGNVVNGKFNDNLQYLTDDLELGTYTVKLSDLPENTKVVLNENTFNKALETENKNEFTLEVSEENLITDSSNRVWGAFRLVEDTVKVEYAVNSNTYEDVKLPETQEVEKGTKITLPELELPEGKVLLGYNVNGGKYSVTNQAGDEIEINEDTTIVAIITSENARAKFVFHEEEFSGKFSTKALNTDVIRAFNVSVKDENKGEMTSVLSGKELLVSMLSKGTHTFEVATPGYEIVKIVDENGNELSENTLTYPVRANGDNLGNRTVYVQVKEIVETVKVEYAVNSNTHEDVKLPETQEVEKGTKITLPELELPEGKVLLGYNVNGGKYSVTNQAGDEIEINEDTTIVAIITSENARANFVFHEEEFSGKFSTKALNTDVIKEFNAVVKDENKGEITSVLSGKKLLVSMLSKGTHTFEVETPGYEIVKIVDENGNELSENALTYPVRSNGDNLGNRTVYVQVKEIESETPEQPEEPKLHEAKGYITGTTNVRISPNGPIIGTLEREVIVEGEYEEGSDWVKFDYYGQEAYVYKPLLSNTIEVKGFVSGDSNIRKSPNGEVTGLAKREEIVEGVVSIDNPNWIKTDKGYIYRPLVVETIKVRGLMSGTTNVRMTPNGTIMGTLGKAEYVEGTLNITNPNWVRIRYQNRDGYVYRSLIVDTVSVSGTVTATVNIRQTPNGKILGAYRKGVKLIGKVYAGNPNWIEIQYNGQRAYVYKEFVK